MLAGVTQATMGVPSQPRWSTRLPQCSEPVLCEDWCLAVFCLPCTAAVAKSNSDRTNCAYNLVCWNPIASYSYVRHEYGINGVCGDDCCYGAWCAPCMVRQMYHESKVRKVSPWGGHYGSNAKLDWTFSLFDCGFCDLFRAFLCPCTIVHEIRSTLQPSSKPDHCFNYCCIMPTAMYGQVRNNAGIITDCPCLEDSLLPLLCFACALTRAKKEAQSLGTNANRR